MTELIKISKSQGGKDIVSGRELHSFLEIETPFHKWMPRMIEYGFSENVDFQCLDKFVHTPNGGIKKALDDYAITLDMAKEISMIQRSEKGKQARAYFIEMEKKAKSAPQHYIPQNYADALLLAANQAKEIEELKEKADYAENVLQSKNTWLATVIAKELGMSAIALNKKLKDLGIQYKRDGVWVLSAKYQDKGYTDTRTHIYNDSNGNICTAIETVWTEAGRLFIYEKLKKSTHNHINASSGWLDHAQL